MMLLLLGNLQIIVKNNINMKKSILTLILFFVLNFIYAQSVLTIEGNNISLEEFKSIFYKKNHDVEISKKYLDEYMTLFVNFKLKVREA